jgi:hypothetical protein
MANPRQATPVRKQRQAVNNISASGAKQMVEL